MSEAMVKASDLDGLMRVADMLGKAGPMLPAHIKSPGEALAVIMAGAELGIPPMASLRGIHLVKGKVGMDYSLMIGLMRRAGYGVQWVTKSATRCELLLTHRDGTTHAEVWDVERAKKAGLWGGAGSWSNYPEAMLTARCTSSAARAFAGDVLAGCYSMDEVREISGGTASIGGSDVHVGEIIDPKDTYDDPKQADEKSRVKAIANAWCLERLPDLEERAAVAVAEMLECEPIDDAEVQAAERKAITAAHRYAIGEWFREHGPRCMEVFAHPATSSDKSKWWNRMGKWAKAAGISADEVKAMMAEVSHG